MPRASCLWIQFDRSRWEWGGLEEGVGAAEINGTGQTGREAPIEVRVRTLSRSDDSVCNLYCAVVSDAFEGLG